MVWSLFLQYLHSLPPFNERPRERRPELGSLPVEILAQVFMHLDFPSVRAVRLTSKTFYSITKTRQFWYNHVNKLVEERHISPPEDALDNYAVGELEQWTLRRSRALDVFANSEQPRFRKRTLELRPTGLSGLERRHFKLLPGGRWLLISHRSAVMYFVDLDCLDPTPRLLFDHREIDDEIRELKYVTFSIWMDRGAPRLSFQLALLVEAKGIFRTYISQIDFAGHGVDATLVASHIAMLRNFNLDVWSVGTTLNDRYLVQAWCDASTKTRLGVYDYRQALGWPDYPMDHNSHHSFDVSSPGIIEFICDDVFAMYCLGLRSLFVLEIGPSTSLRLLHCIQMHSMPWSMPRWTPGASIITMMDRDGRGELQGLVIPHNFSRPPTIVVLANCNKAKRCTYTMGTRVLVAHERRRELLSHDWDLRSPISHKPTLTSHGQEDFSTNILMFDEDTGRFLGYLCRRDLVIYDII